MFVSTHFVTIGIVQAKHGITQMRPEVGTAREMKPTPQTVKDLKPSVGAVVEEP